MTAPEDEQSEEQVVTEAETTTAEPEPEERAEPQRRSKSLHTVRRSGLPTMLGIFGAVLVLLVSAGATIFFLTKPPDDQRLYQQGQKELANGQYAFAVKTLNGAAALRPNDAKVFLALARAYVGVDQLEKAWDCISHAQQLGAGVAAEPDLASDLANYYRQRQKYERAIELLRPLAKAGIQGKKAELADLDALWGDEALRGGNLDQALRCWEEVRDLREGSRFSESDARLATIYQRLANTMASEKNDTQALAYLNKLNNIAQNERNYEMASDIYERTGQLELAIDQLRKAIRMTSRNVVLDKKLASLLNRRGKELLDEGNSDAGLGYLQQAKDITNEGASPTIALRKVNAGLDRSTHMPRIAGEVWNSTEKTMNSLSLRVELVDAVTSKVLWTKEQKVVDEFVPPLGVHDSKPFEFIADTPVKANGSTEFRVYLEGQLYKAYPVGKKGDDIADDDNATTRGALPESLQKPAITRLPAATGPSSISPTTGKTEPSVTPTTATTPLPATTPAEGTGKSSEEKTMKDLDL